MALVDPNIAMSYRGVEIPNQLAQYGQLAQIQNAQNQNRMADLQVQEYERAREEEEGTRNFLRGRKLSDPDTMAGLAQFGKTGLNYAKQLQEQNTAALTAKNTQSQIDERELGVRDKKLKFAWNAVGSASTPEAAIAELTKGVKDGVFDMKSVTPEIQQLQNMSPADYQQYRVQKILGILEAKDKLGFMLPKIERVDTGSGFVPIQANPTMAGFGAPVAGMPVIPKTMTPGEVASNQVARANLKVAQDRLTQDAQGVTYQVNDQGDIVALPSRLSAGAAPVARPVIGKDGTPVKGAPKSKDISVSEQQASYNVSRVLNAANQIKEIGVKDPSSAKPGAGEAFASSIGMEGTANLARNADRQIVYGAQRDALDALLYLATGAAYNKEQLAGQMAAYIPAFTDKADAIVAKKARLAELVKSAKIRAGKAWTPDMESAMQTLTNAESPTSSSKKPASATPYSNLSNEELLKQLSGGN